MTAPVTTSLRCALLWSDVEGRLNVWPDSLDLPDLAGLTTTLAGGPPPEVHTFFKDLKGFGDVRRQVSPV
jgi:hypothetical protein